MADYDPLDLSTWPEEERRQILAGIESTKIDFDKWIGTCPECGAEPGHYCTRPTELRRMPGRVIMTEPHENRPTA